MIKHLLGKHKRRKKEEQEDINIVMQPLKFAAGTKIKPPIVGVPDIRQNVVKDHGYPFLLAAPDGTQNKIWIEAETYHAALLRAQGIAGQAGASVVELW